VIAVQTLTENGRPAAVREQRIVAPRHEDPLRAQAIERIHQLRRLRSTSSRSRSGSRSWEACGS
jgi:hypothetical protein